MLKQLNYVQVWVNDQDEALAFYTEKLGLELREDVTVPELGVLIRGRPPPAPYASGYPTGRGNRRRCRKAARSAPARTRLRGP